MCVVPKNFSRYDEIFDGGVRCAILSANRKSVWANWQGFTIGNGEIWFDGIIPQCEKPDPTPRHRHSCIEELSITASHRRAIQG